MFILRGLDQHLPLELGSQIFPQLSFYTPPTLQFEALKPLTNLSTHASGIFVPLQWETWGGYKPPEPLPWRVIVRLFLFPFQGMM